MNRYRFCLAILAAVSLVACASKPPPIVLGEYVRAAPRDAACAALIEQAAARAAGGGFKLIGMPNARTTVAPGAGQAKPGSNFLAPLGSHLAGLPLRQLDGTFHSLFVQCETRHAYIAKRGGVIDITYWYGPFAL